MIYSGQELPNYKDYISLIKTKSKWKATNVNCMIFIELYYICEKPVQHCVLPDTNVVTYKIETNNDDKNFCLCTEKNGGDEVLVFFNLSPK